MYNTLFLEAQVTLNSGEFVLSWWMLLIIIIGCILVAAIVTFIVTRKLISKQIEKNPPITEPMIRAMMQQMGRTPSERQVRAVMRSMNEAKEK